MLRLFLHFLPVRIRPNFAVPSTSIRRILYKDKVLLAGQGMSEPNSCSRSGGTYSCAGGPTNYVTTEADEKWRSKLTADEYRVARERATEPPFTGKYYKHNQDGIYTCVCCEAELFSSEAKYDSGSGWPSFYEALTSNSDGKQGSGVGRRYDNSHGMTRVETVCNNCDAHLGHVFPDGPKPTGERYCINSLSLKFKPRK